jgi:anti-sigma regulatory factor (Ser/Thr protein kinase)
MRRFDCRLPSAPAATRRAREAIHTVDELADYPDLRFAAQLLTSELVANCVRHAGARAEPLVLRVEWDERTLHAEVSDCGAGFDVTGVLAGYRQRNVRHRGLFFVDALADRWGFRRGDGGFCIWFELDLVPGRRPWDGREPIRRGARQQLAPER